MRARGRARDLVRLGFAVLISAALTAFVVAASNDELLPDEQRRLQQLQTTYSGGTKSGSALNMAVVGQTNLGDRGFNADVFVHDGVAYVGRWGFFDPSHPQFCPSDGGVAVIDVRDPSNPHQVADLRNSGASVEDVAVFTANSGPLAGHDIAAVGLQFCGGARTSPAADGHRGLDLWDVTNPATPVMIAHFDTGCCTRGFHELEVGHQNSRTFVFASLPFAERHEADGVTLRDRQGRGEAWIVDITDPRHPMIVSTFGIRKDLGLDPDRIGQGCFPLSFGHGVNPSEDGQLLFVSYFDGGVYSLDISNAARPRVLDRFVYAVNEDGDGHSTSYDNNRKLLFAADEDFCKTGPGIMPGWGFLRIIDASNPRNLVQIGAFKTKHSLGLADPGAGDFTIHNPFVAGTDVYISWYTDGVRVVDASNPTAPAEVAFFVPPAGKNPIKPSQRNTLSNTTQVWGVVVDSQTGLVYASDMNTGLWILRRTP